jgi:hypothetical protein
MPDRPVTRGYYPVLAVGVVLGGISLVLLISLSTPLEFSVAVALLGGAVLTLKKLRSAWGFESLLIPLAVIVAGAAGFAAFRLSRLSDGVGIVAVSLVCLGAFDLLVRAWESGVPSGNEGDWWDAIKGFALLFTIAAVTVVGFMGDPMRYVGFVNPPFTWRPDPVRGMPASKGQSKGQTADDRTWALTDTVMFVLSDSRALSEGPCVQAIARTSASHGTREIETVERVPNELYDYRFYLPREGATGRCTLRRIDESDAEVRFRITVRPEGRADSAWIRELAGALVAWDSTSRRTNDGPRILGSGH